jgi:AraC-like DNA-binding protein
MANMAYLDNFTESLAFAIGPLFCFYIISTLKGKIKRMQLLHLIPFAFYTLYNMLYIVQPTDLKYHEYIRAYFPEMGAAAVVPLFNTDPLYIREYLNEITILYLLVYYVYSVIILIKAFRKEKVSIFIRRYKNLGWLRNFMLALFVLILILIAVKITFGRDIGDYLISSFMAIIIYGTSANVIRSSEFFTQHLGTVFTTNRKYAKSSLSEENKTEILKKLKEGMENEKYYRNNLVSEIQIAKKLLIPAHHISQVINEKLNQSFFEFIAKYRIRDAQQMLSNPEYNHLTVEEIAEAVGYLSKSAFNKTFKKITGKTPSEYRT